jgi:mono/diheme cytochrome c family protein
MNKFSQLAVLLGVGIAVAARAEPVKTADSERGARLFETEACLQCHSINGKGGKAAPDLGKQIGRNFTPALLTTVMWNHAPTMWAAMEARNIQLKPLDDQAAADLFAYFYSVRFFDRPGDASRGKQLFSSKHCADCHRISVASASGAKPVVAWESLGDLISLAEAMWNHSANMGRAFADQGISWPELTGQNLSDILVYVRNLPMRSKSRIRFEAENSEDGQTLFASKGCAHCHTGQLALGPRLRGKTPVDIAVDMWNHQPKMAQPAPSLDRDEMRKIVSYLWVRQIVQDSGNPANGKKLFAAKKCAACHGDASSGAPNLPSGKGEFSAISMISTLWRHGPRMLDRMHARQIRWPVFNDRQMSDLIAYLNWGSNQ